MTWRPSASIDTLKRRARLLARVRDFFAERGVLEVETPMLSSAATTDPHLASLVTRYTGPGYPRGQTMYLHTSPEFPMKRLLAAGSGSIYQLCKVFRDGETGRRHNPEFTMLEWYRVGFDHHQLMDEVAALVAHVLERSPTPGNVEKLSYRDAFRRHCGIDPHIAPIDAFTAAARERGVSIPADMPTDDLDPWRDLLLMHLIEPELGRGGMTFLYDYPATQAALARLRPGPPALGERFELYMEGIEIANGFHELADATEQRRRFERDLERRRAKALEAVPMDERLLEGLKQGLPPCAGVALGVDRLVMLAIGANTIDEAMAFPLTRA
jgi:lysyl-tRNA synthetase class 2